MTPRLTEQAFGRIFAKLAMQLRWADADEASARSYYEVLAGFSESALAHSAARLSLEPGRQFFPTTAEWAAQARIEDARVLRQALPAAREEPWRYECEACEDTGWERFACSGQHDCGKRKTHPAHEYVRSCPCRPTNRTYQRHQWA